MVNSLYTPFRELLLSGGIDMRAAPLRVTAVNIDGPSGYTFNINHVTMTSVPAGSRVVTVPLTGITVTDGVFDANDVTLGSVQALAGGEDIDAYLIHVDVSVGGGVLVAYLDTGTNLNVVPNGGNITLEWDNGANRIFRI